MAEEEVTLRRRNPKNLGGRPRLEDIEELTPEMEEICQLVRAGFIATEIADRLKITTEKVGRVLDNPRARVRVRKLLGDRLTEIALSRDRLFDAAVESAIRQLQNDRLPITELADILKRYDPYERLDSFLTKDEQRLLKGRKEGGLLGSGHPLPVAGNEEPEPIFGILKVEGG